MRRESFFAEGCAQGIALVFVLLTVPLLACFDTESVICSSGRICGPGLMCDDIQDTCISKSCGDGIVQEGEACDDGNKLAGDGCNARCAIEICGNGTQDPAEKCDDGNTQSGDGCSANCLSIETCGNGYVDTVKEEVCDDGNNSNGDGCSADCRSDESCGNGYMDPFMGEVCDDGNNVNGDGCSADCHSTETCGNKYVDIANGEVCDDGNNNSGDGCSANCRSNETCGNGYVDPVKGEVCDDGNNNSGDGCSANCHSNETCGNGTLDLDVGELCDDGNRVTGDGCSADCKTPGQLCGNAAIESGEECDDGDALNTNDCLTTCRVAMCGDGIVASNATFHHEECDDGNSDSCGTCDARCAKVKMPAKAAIGKISNLFNASDGEWFVLNDGINLPVIFEFTTIAKADEPYHVFVDISKLNDAEKAAAIAGRIGDQEMLAIDAKVDSDSPNTINLNHKLSTALGNRPILKKDKNPFFSVEGMSGGQAADCPAGVGCLENQDCAPGLTCDDQEHVCK